MIRIPLTRTQLKKSKYLKSIWMSHLFSKVIVRGSLATMMFKWMEAVGQGPELAHLYLISSHTELSLPRKKGETLQALMTTTG